ncbi:hypothetical protein FRC12_023563, partial [Ceratobasidium sp. 428]
YYFSGGAAKPELYDNETGLLMCVFMPMAEITSFELLTSASQPAGRPRRMNEQSLLRCSTSHSPTPEKFLIPVPKAPTNIHVSQMRQPSKYTTTNVMEISLVGYYGDPSDNPSLWSYSVVL